MASTYCINRYGFDPSYFKVMLMLFATFFQFSFQNCTPFTDTSMIFFSNKLSVDVPCDISHKNYFKFKTD